MKRFQNTKLSKNDKQIIKNFKTNELFKVLSKEEQDEYWKKILESENTKMIKKLYSKLRWMKSYSATINDTEYFIYEFYEKNFFNIFYYNMNIIKDNNALSAKKEDIDLFGTICSIVIDDIKNMNSLSYKIKLSSAHSKLYFKLIDNVFRENDIFDFKLKKIKGEYFYYKYKKCTRHIKWNPRKHYFEAVFMQGTKFVDRIKLINTLRIQYHAR